MGIRGPNAKPAKIVPDRTPSGRPRRRSWQARGLSRADRVIKFVESLKLTAGTVAGKRFRLRPWQKDIIRAIYATKRGRRAIKTAVVSLPRGQGKTQLCAGLMLAHLVGPEAEPRGELYSAASDRWQAARIYREALAMALADPDLAGRIVARDFVKTLTDEVTGSVYQAMSADSRKGHSLSPSLVIFDELGQAPGRELFDALNTGLGKRPESLMIVISTQAASDQHVLSELIDHGEQVNAGVLEDPSFHCTIYRAPEDADPWDEATWRACNPALDDFLSLEDMKRQADQAKRMPAFESAFRNLRLNMRTSSVANFIGRQDWLACTGEPIDPAELEGLPCWAAVDTSSTTDLSALIAYFPTAAGAVLVRAWSPADTVLEREHRDRAPYSAWVRDGWLETTPGRTIDLRAPVLAIAELMEHFDVRAIGHDRWRIAELRRLMDELGVQAPLLEVGQGFKDLAPCTDALERAILDRRVRHGGHPVLGWNISNVKVQIDPAGNRKPDRAKSHLRIDLAVALIMAVGLAAREPGPIEYDFSGPMLLTG